MEEAKSVVAKYIPRQKPDNHGQNQKLWAISRSSSGRTRHWVNRASWGIPLEDWSTACGWHFARVNVKVELTKFKVTGPKECVKCANILKGRDTVKTKGGSVKSLDGCRVEPLPWPSEQTPEADGVSNHPKKLLLKGWRVGIWIQTI